MNDTTSARADMARVVAAAVLAATLVAAHVGAQDCLSMLPTTLLDTSTDCASEPTIDRVVGSRRVVWQGRPYLFVNLGNEIGVWDIAQPLAPIAVAESAFQVGNQGGSDYDLLSFSVCDDCRYGVAWYPLGTVLFDLGVGSAPGFVDTTLAPDATLTTGGVTFAHGGSQYLVTSSGLAGSCSDTATLFLVNGVAEDDLAVVGCVQADVGFSAAGGEYVDGFLYLASSSTKVYLFAMSGSGTGLSLDYLAQPMRAYFGQGQSLAVDRANAVLLEANSQGAFVWDISDPGNPVQRATIAGSFTRAAVQYPVAFVTQGGVGNQEATFDITDLAAPVPLDQGFWDPEQPWNYPGHLCTFPQGGQLSFDGTVLYLLRWSRLQMVDTTSCLGSGPIFADGFESGGSASWSSSTP